MYIHVKVTAHARKEEFKEIKKDHFTVSVKEKAEHNMANSRVMELLATHFSLPLNKVRIVNGHHSPSKLFSIGE